MNENETITRAKILVQPGERSSARGEEDPAPADHVWRKVWTLRRQGKEKPTNRRPNSAIRSSRQERRPPTIQRRRPAAPPAFPAHCTGAAEESNRSVHSRGYHPPEALGERRRARAAHRPNRHGKTRGSVLLPSPHRLEHGERPKEEAHRRRGSATQGATRHPMNERKTIPHREPPPHRRSRRAPRSTIHHPSPARSHRWTKAAPRREAPPAEPHFFVHGLLERRSALGGPLRSAHDLLQASP